MAQTSIVDDRAGTNTFPELVAGRVAASPDAPAFFSVSFDGHHAKAAPHSWSEIVARARCAAGLLTRAGVGRGDRVILCLTDPARFLSFYLGAQALGAIPVPLPSAGEMKAREAFRARADSVIADCVPGAMVVDTRDDLAATNAGGACPVIVADITDSDTDGDVSPTPFCLERSRDEIAYIQYTSGSTGSPKGVLVTHANLMANLRAIARGADLGPSDIGFNWLPLYHDMGLIGGLLLGLYVGGGGYVMPTRMFIGGPALWLRAMSQFKATFCAAPNFAFSLLARHMRDEAIADLDLSHWRRAFNGAEPVDRSCLEAFMKRFAPAGLRAGTMCPVYGLAECTLAASLSTPDAPPRYDFVDRAVLGRERRAVAVDPAFSSAACFVSVGRAVPEHRIRIVEPHGLAELPERHVGEVVVTGPSVTPGYYNGSATGSAAARELRTGDLGYVAGGELYIVDRLKDLLIVGGRNIVPSDVERVVAAVHGIRYGAVGAFSIRGSAGTEELYLVAGAAHRALHNPEVTRNEIKAAVFRHFSVVPRDVLLVPPSAVPKTSSGKIQRSACRELYQRGALATQAGLHAEATVRPPMGAHPSDHP